MIRPRLMCLLTVTSRKIRGNGPTFRSLSTEGKKAPGTSQLKAPLLFGIGLMTGLLIFDSEFGPDAGTLDDTKKESSK